MVKEQIVIIFNENKKRYGYRRITKELHNNDICVNHKTVRKLMKQLGLVCQIRAKRKYSSYKGEVGEVAPNLLERHFKTNQPNRKWVTDVTEFKVNDQKLYLSPILDLFNGEVVSYNLSRHPNFKQITDMLEGAFQKLPDKVDNLTLHSDQGWQYQMKSYQNLLKAKGITQSMSRKATCLDNAVAENFFGLLKTELFYLEKFDSIDQLEKAIVDYYYPNQRLHTNYNVFNIQFCRLHIFLQLIKKQEVVSSFTSSCDTSYNTLGGVSHMKNKLDWFDDNWNWDVRLTRVLYELLLSPTYRIPMRVKEVCSFKWGVEFPRCPRCETTMEREYQLFCDRCGQRLNWSRFDECEVKYIGWDGPEDDEKSDAGGEQVDDGDQEDTAKID